MNTKPKWDLVFDGRDAREIIRDLRRDRGVHIGPYAREALSRWKGRPPVKGTVQEATALSGDEFGAARNRTTKKILGAANRHGFRGPTPEAALLLRDAFPQEELGYSRVIVFHKPLIGHGQEPGFLSLSQKKVGKKAVDSIELVPAQADYIQRADDVFAFILPEDPNHRIERELLCPLGRARRRYPPCGRGFVYAA